MKKALLLASLCASLATAAGAQTPPPTASPAPDTRAADLERLMDIRSWQAGPSAGDAAAKSDPAAPAPTADQRASDLQKMMEIRSWQTGPSSGDAAAKAEVQAPPAGSALNFSNPAMQDGLRMESTP
jgi:hypothetical protein